MKSWRMFAIIKIILIPIVIAAVVSATPRYLVKTPLIITKPKNKAVCLPLGTSCMKSKLPCCTLSYRNSYLHLGEVLTTCFKFGKGICQVNKSIENFEEYTKLAKQLNSTNFQELKDKYLDSIEVVYTCTRKITIGHKNG